MNISVSAQQTVLNECMHTDKTNQVYLEFIADVSLLHR